MTNFRKSALKHKCKTQVSNLIYFYFKLSFVRPNLDSKNFFGIIHALKKISCDVIYLNSFFSPHFTIIPLLIFKLTGIAKKIPIIIATHGEFSSSALRIKKIKKNHLTDMS